METNSLVAVSDELRKQRDALQTRVANSRAQLTSMEDELSRLEAALLALGQGKPKRTAHAADRKTRNTSTASPSPKKSDVIEAMQRFLSKGEVVAASNLKTMVENDLQQQGFNRFGFAMRWTEACNDTRFSQTPAGICLATTQTLAVSSVAPSVSGEKGHKATGASHDA